jgi:IclR family KDG regulon transcriptional repressor
MEVAFSHMKQPGSEEAKEQRDSKFLRALESAFRILEFMSRSEKGVRVTDASKTLQLPKATVFRILFTLQQLGYARKDPITRTYVVVSSTAWLNHDGERDTLRRVARPYMERLLARFEQTVNLAVLDRDQVLYTEIIEGLRSIRMAATVNTYAPIYATGIGKSMLAFLHPIEAEEILKRKARPKLTSKTMTSIPVLLKAFKRIREQGYAIDNEEAEMGARCVAAPIFNAQGRPIAAISVSAPASYMSGTVIPQVGQMLLDVTRKASAQLGFRLPPKGKHYAYFEQS